MENSFRPEERAVAIFGGGCFWCLEAVFSDIRGVLSVTSGYCGGHTDHPSYEQVCSGNTGHAEVVRICFDPTVIDFSSLLEMFFAAHDPTTLNRQGNDVGSQYRSVIFCLSEAQRREAVAAKVAASRDWGAPAVTTLEDAAPFYAAERYHQDYFARNGAQTYCQYVIAPKLAKVRRLFAHRLGG